MNRRLFFQSAALTAALPAVSTAKPVKSAVTSMESRSAWVDLLLKVAGPVIANLAVQRLKKNMPVEAQKGHETKRSEVSHLEALGRTLAGIAPWLAASGLDASEEVLRDQTAEQTRQALKNAVTPGSADKLNFTAASQNLVDAAFLALGISRARSVLWDKLDASTREHLIAAMQSTRQFEPGQNNWLLFSAIIEAFLASVGASWQPGPIEKAVLAHEQWYQGDGIYGDGPDFHWDHYNSFVIQPMLLAVLDLITPTDARWSAHASAILKRARRYAVIQERLIATDGTYPPIGRSITYRCGAFHHLASMALNQQLPAGLAPAQVRNALSAVIDRTLNAPGTFDEQGWLRIGLCGHQPSLGESYISTGSLYLCTLAFLPLGLPPQNEFWVSPSAARASQQIWSGVDLPADHAL